MVKHEKKVVDRHLERQVDKQLEKVAVGSGIASTRIDKYLKYGFWTMVVLFVLNVLFSYLGWLKIGVVIEALFYLSIILVFITSIKRLLPEGKAFAVTALILSSVFIIFIILVIVIMVLTSASAGLLG